jgi:NAD(P)-dependent dehydrogenase (short-subunit alcohol dehydrogenase family)
MTSNASMQATERRSAGSTSSSTTHRCSSARRSPTSRGRLGPRPRREPEGPFLLSQAAAPLLRRDGGGVIINIVDLSALQPWPSFAHHAVSKAGLLHLTRVLARALAPDIRVNAIAPGTVLPPEDHRGRGRQRAARDRARGAPRRRHPPCSTSSAPTS